METSTILIIPKRIKKNVPFSEIRHQFGPFVRVVNQNGMWHINAMVYYNSEFSAFGQTMRDTPFMYDNLLPLQSVTIAPSGPRIPHDDDATFTLWQFVFRIEKDPYCCGLYFMADLMMHMDEPTRGTVVMGESPT
ncbi:hypothetical protein GWK08_09725 [Leptobacterium flavescens]|uniref:Uncharacterized protein n=1 Tax=Leptobacterium flavescens TaxID=472055 RepID=A0A6P0UL67_9FLAO|nr:hypothetical protein [Leptobacterium flavescens]NER13717.1 hypothetical protein [Leptobacterium flavescens]